MISAYHVTSTVISRWRRGAPQNAALALASTCSAYAASHITVRHRLIHASILSDRRTLLSGEDTDYTCKKAYIKRRQADAIAVAVKEKAYLAEKAAAQLQGTEAAGEAAERRRSLIDEARELGGEAAVRKVCECLAHDTKGPSYVRSVDAFGDMSVRLQHTFAGLADNRVIQWWEYLYWNTLRYFFTQEVLIAKDRFGNKFTVTWQFIKSREEQRRMYRKDRNKRHQPYGALATDDRLWERWLRSHRGDPPSVAEEEHLRNTKKEYFGPMVLENEEVEDSLMRMMAHLSRSSQTFEELDEDQTYGDRHRRLKPMRSIARCPGESTDPTTRKESGATWTLGFVRGDRFYNEEETEVMRHELCHVFRNKEWQNLEYKRQVRVNHAQHPRGKPGEGSEKGQPLKHYWQRSDLGIPYHDAVPDLTTPELERLRIESDQLEDERLALRKELGLTDLGDIREGRGPIDTGHAPFQMPPVSARWKPKCWEEPWGTGSGLY